MFASLETGEWWVAVFGLGIFGGTGLAVWMPVVSMQERGRPAALAGRCLCCAQASCACGLPLEEERWELGPDPWLLRGVFFLLGVGQIGLATGLWGHSLGSIPVALVLDGVGGMLALGALGLRPVQEATLGVDADSGRLDVRVQLRGRVVESIAGSWVRAAPWPPLPDGPDHALATLLAELQQAGQVGARGWYRTDWTLEARRETYQSVVRAIQPSETVAWLEDEAVALGELIEYGDWPELELSTASEPELAAWRGAVAMASSA